MFILGIVTGVVQSGPSPGADISEVCKDRYGPDAEAVGWLEVEPPHAVCHVDGEKRLPEIPGGIT